MNVVYIIILLNSIKIKLFTNKINFSYNDNITFSKYIQYL